MIKIIADSTCSLPPDILRRYDIRIAPIAIQFGNQTYEEGIDIDADTFYRRIESEGIIPTTSQPTPAWFAKYYAMAAEHGDSVLVITITSKHSGTYQSALVAKSMVPQAQVEVFDSASIAQGTGWMILEAARAIESARDRASILARLETIRSTSHLFITPATLRYLQMSGRVGKLQGALASLLNVKPMITLKDGVLEAGENVRTRGKALERLLAMTDRAVGTTQPVNMAVIHARVPQEAAELAERARSRFNVRELLVGDMAYSLAVHGGPGIMGVFAYPV